VQRGAISQAQKQRGIEMNSHDNIWKPILITMWTSVILCGWVLNARAEYPQMVCPGDQCVITPQGGYLGESKGWGFHAPQGAIISDRPYIESYESPMILTNIGERPPSYDGEIAPSYDVVTPPTQSPVSKPLQEISVGYGLGKGDSPKDSLFLSAIGVFEAGGWVITGDIGSIKSTVKDTLTESKERIVIEADKFFTEGAYCFLWAEVLEMPLSGMTRNAESIAGVGYQVGPKLFIETGVGHRRTVFLGGDSLSVLDKTGVVYLGGEVDHVFASGVTLKGQADYTFGDVVRIGRGKATMDIPVQGSGVKLRVSFENVVISPAPVGKLENNSTTNTALVYQF
jgi:thiamine pyrophosphokinase